MHFYKDTFWEDWNIISLKMVLWKDQRACFLKYDIQKAIMHERKHVMFQYIFKITDHIKYPV